MSTIEKKSPDPAARVKPTTVHVSAPARLHFGMLSVGGAGRQFGGAGLMIQRPRLELRITRAARLAASGPLAERAVEFARRWARNSECSDAPDCQIEIISAPPQHVGLGAGTQLGLSVAAGLTALFGKSSPTPKQLAAAVGRGRRSAIGAYGFVYGGLIVEPGKAPGESLAPLSCRVDIPSTWRILLLRPTDAEGLAGAGERNAFSRLPPTPPDVTQSLIAELRERLIPAATDDRFDDFSESLFRYGKLSGECFRRVQGGSYNGPRLTRLVDEVRQLGIRGVAQSSWGPTLFAVLPDELQAEWLAQRLKRRLHGEKLELIITPPANQGARICCADRTFTADCVSTTAAGLSTKR